MSLRYLNVVSRRLHQLRNVLFLQMQHGQQLKDRERIAKQIAKMSNSIRKKYHALKTRKIEATKKHFKSIIEPLKQCQKYCWRGISTD